MYSASDNRRGIISMLLAMALFVGNDTTLKLVSTFHPTSQIMAVRGFFACALAFLFVVISRDLGKLHYLFSVRVIVRALLEAGVALTYITSLAFLPLANINAIMQAAPILLALFTVVLGIAQIGWRRWCAIAVGFLGVMLIVRPNPYDFNIYAGLAFVAACFIATRDLVTRGLDPDIPSSVVTLATTLIVAGMGLVGGLFGSLTGTVWTPIPAKELVFLTMAAIFVTIGNFAVILAFRGTDITVVSPFRYAVVVMAIALGYFIFGDLPDLMAWCGIILIVGSGLYAMHREKVRLERVRLS